ncbi:MAG: hypothetical protein M1819_004145 [Sarea resinae]|nr:MAG: hypothetical protein M1819_004145 [Sarea resinae]
MGDSPLSQGTRTPTSGKPFLEDPSNSYWRLTDSSPTTTGYPMFSYASSAAPSFPQSDGAIEFTRQSTSDGGWPAYTRSMSFGRADGVSNYYGAPQPRQGYQRPISPDLYPPSLNTSHTSSMDSMSEASSAPLSAPAGSQHGLHNLGYTNGWGGIGGPSPGTVVGKGTDGSTPWYGEPTQLTQVEEETRSQFPGGGPSIYYSGENYRPE